MGTFFVFFGILLLSQFVALLVGLQLADYFRATEEFIAVMMLIIVGSMIVLVIFSVAYHLARSVRPFRHVAIALVVVMLVLLALPAVIPWLYEPTVNPLRVTAKDVPILLELLLPGLALILVQWGLVRRRWLRMHGEDDLSAWPWVTTVAVGLAVLNPVGLEFAASALRPSADRTMALAGVAALVVMACIEIYVRGRMLRRRVAVLP